MTDVDAAVAAIEAGELAIIPTDTVYGLAATPHVEAAVRRLYRAKGRVDAQPTALVVRDLDALRECLPELTGAQERVAQALLPGPYTLILPNPTRRFPWLAGSRPETIGVRIPALTGPVRDVLSRVGALVATSANMGNLAGSGVVGFGMTFRAIAVMVVVIAVAATDAQLALAVTLLYALAYSLELAVSLALYFSGETRETA